MLWHICCDRLPQEPPQNSRLDWLPKSHPLIPIRSIGLSTIGISASRLPQLPSRNGLLLTSLCGERHSPSAHWQLAITQSQDTNTAQAWIAYSRHASLWLVESSNHYLHSL